ncbi:MAG: tyrosine-type recombinase/integrase [Clostridiales Family XIII bacterium]|jgi:site-specific recombinase XerD|nr:tyrosine-type recombinase/integrase [Clostridiales Family XIII bacterium]
MSKFNLQEVSEQVLRKLEERGLKGISDMRSVSFGMAIRYFRRQGASLDAITTGMLESFLLEFRRMYEAGQYSVNTWEKVQRGVGLVKHYVQTGEILDRRLPSWKHTHNPLRIAPPTEQLADNDNIWGLVWRAREELIQVGYTPRMCMRYGYGGFDKILRRHTKHKTDRYCPEIVEETVSEHRACFADGEINRTTYSDLRKAGLMLDELHKTGHIAWKVAEHWGTRQPVPEFKLCINAHTDFAMTVGELAPVTIGGTKSSARALVFELEELGYCSFAGVTLAVISDALTALAQRRAAGGISGFFSDIRRFLRFLYRNGYTKVDLSIAIPEYVAEHRSFGYGFSREEILALLNSVNVTSGLGKRDFAMLTLAAQTGLRAIDIVNLKRDNINWRSKEIKFVQHKTGKQLSLPLEPESGNAIADYLLTARPKCESPNIFITHTVPLRPLGSSALQGRVRKYMGIGNMTTLPGCGVHSFRRGFGTRLLESETPIELLHQMLGQTCMESAKPYIAVNDEGLRMCSLDLAPLRKAGGSNE